MPLFDQSAEAVFARKDIAAAIPPELKRLIIESLQAEFGAKIWEVFRRREGQFKVKVLFLKYSFAPLVASLLTEAIGPEPASTSFERLSAF